MILYLFNKYSYLHCLHLEIKGENMYEIVFDGRTKQQNIMEDVSRVSIALKYEYETLEHLQWPVELLISKYFIYSDILNIKKLVNNNVMS